MEKPRAVLRSEQFDAYIIYLLEQINSKLDKIIEPEVVIQESEAKPKKTRRKKNEA